jgi:3'-5' exoribonuclease
MKKFNDGEVISAIVLIKTVTKDVTKSGNDYLRLEIYDGQSTTTAFVWDLEIYNFKEGEVVKLKGKYSTYNNKPKIDVISVSKTTEKLKLPSLSSSEIEDLINRFNKLRELIIDDDFKAIFNSLFDNEKIWEMFIAAPAAKSNHQAYLGGLLQHSVEVTELAYTIYQTDSKNINLSLLIAGALLHDIGKIKEYIFDTKLDRSTSGKLVGHTSLGLLIIVNFLPENIPVKKSTELFHLILSHHGKREWGAPVEPLMKEATIIHNCDMINSYNSRFNEVKEQTDSEFSEFDETYKRNWYLRSNHENEN